MEQIVRQYEPYRPNDSLRGFGYTNLCLLNKELQRVNILCSGEGTYPDIEIILAYDFITEPIKPIADSGQYSIHSCQIKLEDELIPIHPTENISFGISRKRWSLSPSKEFLETLCKLFDEKEALDHLWILARYLASSDKRFISRKKVESLYDGFEKSFISSVILSHPFLKRNGWKQIGFSGEEIPRFLIARELNKRNSNIDSLRNFIDSKSLKFLDYNSEHLQKFAFEKLEELKNDYVKRQRYEEAAHIRDGQKDFAWKFIQTYWPHPKDEFIEPFFEKFRSELIQYIDHEMFS
ncbi:MAG: UvrB/UvrC motif-containing protein [Bacteroidota bacterium]